jgi:hypothetical protein
VDLVRAGAAGVNTTESVNPAEPADAAERGIPPLFARLCDDAALFPPGNAPAAQAVLAHRAHKVSWYRDLVGPFLAAPKHLTGVAKAARDHETLVQLALVVPDGPGSLAGAVRATAGEPGIELVGVELACAADGSPAEAAREAVWALDRELPLGVGGVVEVRRGAGIAEALDVLAASSFRAKLRTGGTVAQAFPTEAELAEFIVGCVVRRLPFKCTAGLHEAVRHTDKATGFEHHGFLNILTATGAAVQGADAAVVASVLGVRSGPELVSALRQLTPDAVGRTRRAFTAYGTCSIAEPLADLVSFGALELE